MALLRSLATVSGYTGLSRVLGFVRDVLIASMLGTGPIADAFFVAFRLPNLFRRFFAEGAFNAAFVPLFARKLEQVGKEAARLFAERTQALLLVVMLGLTVLALAFMPWLLYLLAPGFIDEPEKYALTVELSRIAFPYLLFMTLVALMSGVLNSLYRFAEAAAAPVLLNAFFIAALVLVIPQSDSKGQILAWTVSVAGVAQLLLMAFACKRAGVTLRLPFPHWDDDMKRVIRLMAPGALSAGALQFNVMVGTIIASLQASAVSYLYYADRVYQLPLGLIGIAFAVVLLPDLSRKLRAGEDDAATSVLNRGLELAMLLTLPAAFALMAIAQPIVIVLFERGAFDRPDSLATAWALAAYGAGLPAFVLIKLLQTPYFAREDTVTPFKYAVTGVAANIVLSLALFFPFGYVGLPAATSTAAWLNAALLLRNLDRRGFLDLDRRARVRLPRILIASLAMAVALWAASLWLAPFLDGSLPLRVLVLVLLVVGGGGLYGALAVTIKAASIEDLTRLKPRRRV